MEYLTLLLAGSASGFVAGMVGLAGGIVIVPALTWLYGHAALHDAIVVSWFAVLANSIGAARGQIHIRTPQERSELIAWSKFFLAGALVAALAVAVTLSEGKHGVSAGVVGALQLCLAMAMLFPAKQTVGASVRPTHPMVDTVAGATVGAVSTLIGVGGGTYTIAYMVHAARRPFREAIATANFSGLVIGAFSVVGFAVAKLAQGSRPDVHTHGIGAAGIALLIVSGAICSGMGVRVAQRVQTKTLKNILIGVLVVSAVRLMLF
jgi:uncharacterized membrane protein YfcA